MWTPTTRREHSRDHLRCGCDLSDAEWALIAPFLPPPGRTGRPRRWPMREIMSAIFCALRPGCPWRMVPDCFAPATTVDRWFVRLREEGVFVTLNHHPLLRDRERLARLARPSAAVIDSQSTKSTEAGGPRGYDAGKKVKGRKRHAMVDTDGRALVLRAQPASIQDRDGAVPLLQASRRGFPFVEHAFADRAYAANRVATATRITVHPRRWVVERFVAWIGRDRRLAKDFEAPIVPAEAFLYAAAVMLLIRRPARAA